MSEAPVPQSEPAVDGGTARGGLAIRDLTVLRGNRPVVQNVSIDVPPGEITALLGPNGAGKSSLVLGVAGVLKPTAGSVVLDDADLAGARPEKVRQAGIAVVPEGRRLLPNLTVGDNIEVACYALSKEDGRTGRDYALELFPELQKRLDVSASALSGGEQQMLVLAQAIVSKPRFILIDELSLGLAPVIVQRLVPTVRTVADSGVGVLLIEQFAHVALGLANHAHVMEGGRIQFSGLAGEFKERPELLQAAYLLGGAEAGSADAAEVARRIS